MAIPFWEIRAADEDRLTCTGGDNDKFGGTVRR